MKIYFGFLFFLLIAGCISQPESSKTESNYKKPPPPPLSPEDQKICDSLKFIAYHELSNGRITIIFNDTIRNNKALYQRFVLAFKTMGFNHYRLYDLGFESNQTKYCIQPIMDSTIIAKYGPNAKDSFINAARRMADTLVVRRNL